MEGQHPLTIILLVAIGALVLLAGYQGVRMAWGIAQGFRDRRPDFDVKAYAAGLAALERDLADLPLDAARAEAERLLGVSPFLRSQSAATDVQSDTTHLAALTPLQRELVTRYAWVGLREGDEYVAAREIGPYEYEPAYVRLGPASVDGHVDLVTRPGEEPIYQLANDDPAPRQPEFTARSIYHWLIYLHRRTELEARCSVRPPEPRRASMS
jgi:hypothetical protein